MRPEKPLAHLAIRAAGRAWMPSASSRMRVSRALSPEGSASSATAVVAVAWRICAPRSTRPGAARTSTAKASPLVMITGVHRLGAASASAPRSSCKSRSPAFTDWPAETCGAKPFPSSFTVSIPAWIRISAPLPAFSVTACRVRLTAITSASQGAYSPDSSGSIPMPGPRAPPAKAASGMASSATTKPRQGAWISTRRPASRRSAFTGLFIIPLRRLHAAASLAPGSTGDRFHRCGR